MKGLRLAARHLVAALIAAAAAGCAQDPLADSVSTHQAVRSGEPSGPAKVATMMRVAAATEQSGDFGNASLFYRRAHETNIQLGRKDAAPLVGLGRTMLALGAHNEAAESFRSALAIAPDDPQALRGLGNALIAMDQLVPAVTNLEAAVAKAPDVQSYSSLGVAYDLLDRRASAQAAYRKGLELDPDNIALRNNLGLSLAFSGDFTEALYLLERVSADTRATLRQKLNLALAYGLAGDTDAAERILVRYLDATSVGNNLAYYKTLRALQNRKLAARSVGVEAGGLITGDVAGSTAAAPTPVFPPPAQTAVTAPVVDETPLRAEPATGAPVALAPPVRSPKPETQSPVTAVAASEPVAETPAARKQPPVATVAAQETTAERPTAAAPPSASPSAPSFATVPEARPARAAAGGGAIRVQFAAFRSQAEAEDSWRRLVATAPDAFAGIVPVIEPGYSGSDPTLFYRLRSAPFATRAEASDFCTRLKPRGIDCIVVRDPAPPKQP